LRAFGDVPVISTKGFTRTSGGIAAMSFGFSISDFVTISAFAWKIYKSCKDSSDGFKSISSDVAGLHIVLKETEENLSEQNLDADQERRLNDLCAGCNGVLKDLDSLLERYNSLGTKSQRTWDRMKWGLEDISDMRERLTSNTAMLTAFNTALTRYVTSQFQMERAV
jgi:hypothetical protein